MKTKLNAQASKLATVFAPVLLAYHTAEMKLEKGFKEFLHTEFHKYWDALPEAKRADNSLAVQWKRDAIAAADSLGYQGQWVSKCLMAIEPDLFRQRAVRKGKGEKKGANKRTESAPPKPLTDSQIQFEVGIIRTFAKRHGLNSVTIEDLIVAIMKANSDLAAHKAA